MIEAIEGKGVNRAKAICDECNREEVVSCDYEGTKPHAGQVKSKITAHGWSDIKGKLRCPKCEAQRKVVNMAAAKKKTEAADAAPPEMSKRQKIDITLMLAEVYDLEAGRYRQGDTDDTVADVLGLRPGWVMQVREADFGPDGGNESIEELIERLEGFVKQVQAILESAAQQHEAASKKLAEASAMRAELDRIRKAVGPRVLRVAKS